MIRSEAVSLILSKEPRQEEFLISVIKILNSLENATCIWSNMLIDLSVVILEELSIIMSIDKVDILNKLEDIYISKNSDYGNSFQTLLEKFGKITLLVRLYDKFLRYITLTKKGKRQVLDETKADTLNDMLNYAIMGASYSNIDKLKL